MGSHLKRNDLPHRMQEALTGHGLVCPTDPHACRLVPAIRNATSYKERREDTFDLARTLPCILCHPLH